LHRRIKRLAHGFRSLGVGAGDRVAYLGPNHPRSPNNSPTAALGY